MHGSRAVSNEINACWTDTGPLPPSGVGICDLRCLSSGLSRKNPTVKKVDETSDSQEDHCIPEVLLIRDGIGLYGKGSECPLRKGGV
jgi:hypothetical protein